jgi:tetratricopeptide (TPR) repeat protein
MRVKQIGILIIAVLAVVSCGSYNSVSTKNTKKSKHIRNNKEQQYYYVFIEANRKKILGDIQGALELYYECLKIKPEAAAAMYEISNINKILKNYDSAIKYARLAVENDRENKWYKLNLAELLITTKNYEEAVKVYEEAYLIDKQDLEIPYKMAALYTHMKNYERAIELYNEIESSLGVQESLSLAKQQLYYNLGQKTKAYDEIEELIKHYPGEPRYYGILAEMYTNDNLFIKAKENYDKLFKIDSTNELGLLSIIDYYRKKMDYEQAFKTVKKVIDNEQIEYNQKVIVLVSILNTRSEFNIYNQQIEEMLSYFKQMYPDRKDSYTIYADYLIKMNELEKAKTELEFILNTFEGNIALWEQLLYIYSYNNNFDTLYKQSKRAIDSFPKHDIFYLFNGISGNQTDKSKEAIRSLEKGLNLAKTDEIKIDFYTNLAEALYDNKEYEKSDYYFDLVLQKQPDNLYVRNNYAYYLSLREEKLEYAESLSKVTIEKEPNNSTYLDTYAWILYKLERYQDALFYIKRAFERGGAESVVIVEHYGDILYKVGNVDAAIQLWKLSKELGNKSKQLVEKIEKKSLN